MLRITLVILLLANLLYAAWAAGGLRNFGLLPPQVSEPERIAAQIAPQSLRVLPSADAARLEAEARSAQCLQAGPLAAGLLPPLRDKLAGWPLGSWTLVEAPSTSTSTPTAAPAGTLLRLPVVDDALRARLADLPPLLGTAELQPCH
ncbi:MAG: hypothetical protein ACO27H_12145 [Burkholderiaceae bacterium]|jgi:hypothetical protein